jgi:thioesterase domain-containing protein/acyl carrier protein
VTAADRTLTGHGTTPPTAARDDVELQVCDIWQAVLGVPDVGVHDDFFDIGGNSLGAIAVVIEMRKLFGVDVTADELLEASTVAQLAEVVRRGGSAVSRPLVRLREGPHGATPVYGFPGASGTVLVYVRLMHALGAGRPFWGLRSVGLEPGEQPLRTIEDIADDFIARMLPVHPEGHPWNLLGYSMGGVCAYEVAKRLAAAGQRVGLVGLLDTRPYLDTGGDPDYALRALLRRRLKLDLDLDWVRGLSAQERARVLLASAVEAGTVPADFDADRLRRTVDMYQHNMDALNAYDPGYFDGEVTVFRIMDRSLEPVPLADDLGWNRFARAVVVHDVPGTHFTMLQPGNVENLAAAVSASIRTPADSLTRLPWRAVACRRKVRHGASAGRSRSRLRGSAEHPPRLPGPV